MKLKWVWFDLGYTLVYNKRETAFQKAIMRFGFKRDFKDIHYGFYITDKLFMRKYRGIFLKERKEFMPFYLSKLFKYLHLRVNKENINEILKEFYYFEDIQVKEDGKLWHAYEDSRKVLSILKNQSIKLGIISNWDNTARNVLKTNDLYNFFDEIIISSEVNISKPNRKIFEIAINRSKAVPDECLYVGDNYYDDTLGCSKVGMHSVIINPYEFDGINGVDVIFNIGYLPNYIEAINDGLEMGIYENAR